MSEMQLGSKIGPRIASLVSQSIVYTHERLIHIKHRLALAVFHSISDIISEEAHHVLDPVISGMHESLDGDSQAYKLLEFMATKRGQLQAGAGISLAAGSILGSIAQVVNNELAPSVYANLASNPHSIPDPFTIANLYAKGTIPEDQAIRAIGENGIAYGWATPLLESAQQVSDAATLLDMLRRGLIDETIFRDLAIRSGLRGDIADLMLSLKTIPLTPADAALAQLRGNLTASEAYAKASQWGISQDDFNTLIGNTGEPPGTQQMLEAFRRGFIDQATLEKGIRESRVRDEWIPMLLALRFSPMTTADAVQAVVQNHMDQATGAAISEQNGLAPGAFDTLYQTAGEPLSRTELEQLFNRGVITKDQVLQGLRESRLKDKYGEYAFDLHEKLLEPRELAAAVEYGSITHADGVAQAMAYGFNQNRAEQLINSASVRKTFTYRQEGVKAIETMYVDGTISEDTLRQLMGSFGWETVEIDVLARTAELKRQTRLLNSGINAVRSKYVAHHIDRTAAINYLGAIGVPEAQTSQFVKLWDIEVDANAPELTLAQLTKAYKLQLLTLNELSDRLLAKGYHPDDVALLLGTI